MSNIPFRIKKRWADLVGGQRSIAEGESRRQIEYIQKSFPLKRLGWLDINHLTLDEKNGGLEDYPIFNQMTEKDAKAVKPQDILKAFERVGLNSNQLRSIDANSIQADHDKTGPSMRLSYEYLQCVGYDRGFYDALVAEKQRQRDA